MHADLERVGIDSPQHRDDVARDDRLALGAERDVRRAAEHCVYQQPFGQVNGDSLVPVVAIEHYAVSGQDPDAIAHEIDPVAVNAKIRSLPGVPAFLDWRRGTVASAKRNEHGNQEDSDSAQVSVPHETLLSRTRESEQRLGRMSWWTGCLL